jgi:tetratricopeptide (TPR) repeat protein
MNVLESKIDRRHRVLNPRAAVIIAAIAMALLFGVRKLHNRQFGKTIDFLRQSAYAALESDDFRKAQMGLNQYLAFRSSDLDARQKLSSLLSTHIRTRPALEQAFQLNEELLRNDLPQEELRLEQSRIAVDLGMYSDALAHLRILQKLRPDSAEIWYLSAHCKKESRNTDEAVDCYQRALDCPNSPERAFEELAMLAKANPQLMLDPENILDQMVIDCNSATARRLRAMQLVHENQFSRALSHVWKGLDAAPDDIALNAILVNCLQSIEASAQRRQLGPQKQSSVSNADLLRGIRHLHGCVERESKESSFRIHLAALLCTNQQPVEAIRILEAGISRDSQAFELYGVLIEYLLTFEQTDKARELFQTLPANALPGAEHDLLLGRFQLLRNDWTNAEASLQRAVASSEPDSGLQQRAQMLLAVCRSNSGDSTTAVNAFRTILAGAPDSVAGQLGMASAWIKAGRKDLAIAEYRQLLDVPGVPAFLADLMIQRNLELRASLRDWSEVADLVRDRDPFITDLTQRTLLQVDMWMASGRLSEAIAALENASAADPENTRFQRALAILNSQYSGELQNQLRQLAIKTPENHDVLATLVRLDLSNSRADEALAILESVAHGQRSSHLNSSDSLLLAIRTAEQIVARETHLGRTQYTEIFCEAARRYALQLTTLNAGYEATLARVLARQGRASEAMQRVKLIDATQDPINKASALMALVQYTSLRQSVLPDAMRELRKMINATPGSIELRICYADLLIYDNQLETADQVLEQIQNIPPDDGEVAARRAWILAVTSGSPQEASDLIAHAIQMQPQNSAFRVMKGRILMAAGKYAEVLSGFNGLNADKMSQAALTYQAAALLEMNETDEAWRTIKQLRLQDVREPMFPADEKLLQTVKNQLTER